MRSTYMISTLLWTEGWINCMTGTARSMDNLDNYLSNKEADRK